MPIARTPFTPIFKRDKKIGAIDTGSTPPYVITFPDATAMLLVGAVNNGPSDPSRYAYVAHSTNQISVVDLATTATVVDEFTDAALANVTDMIRYETGANTYLLCIGDDFAAVDITDPTSLSLTSTLAISGTTIAVAPDARAYVGDANTIDVVEMGHGVATVATPFVTNTRTFGAGVVVTDLLSVSSNSLFMTSMNGGSGTLTSLGAYSTALPALDDLALASAWKVTYGNTFDVSVFSEDADQFWEIFRGISEPYNSMSIDATIAAPMFATAGTDVSHARYTNVAYVALPAQNAIGAVDFTTNASPSASLAFTDTAGANGLISARYDLLTAIDLTSGAFSTYPL